MLISSRHIFVSKHKFKWICIFSLMEWFSSVTGGSGWLQVLFIGLFLLTPGDTGSTCQCYSQQRPNLVSRVLGPVNLCPSQQQQLSVWFWIFNILLLLLLNCYLHLEPLWRRTVSSTYAVGGQSDTGKCNLSAKEYTKVIAILTYHI